MSQGLNVIDGLFLSVPLTDSLQALDPEPCTIEYICLLKNLNFHLKESCLYGYKKCLFRVIAEIYYFNLIYLFCYQSVSAAAEFLMFVHFCFSHSHISFRRCTTWWLFTCWRGSRVQSGMFDCFAFLSGLIWVLQPPVDEVRHRKFCLG